MRKFICIFLMMSAPALASPNVIYSDEYVAGEKWTYVPPPVPCRKIAPWREGSCFAPQNNEDHARFTPAADGHKERGGDRERDEKGDTPRPPNEPPAPPSCDKCEQQKIRRDHFLDIWGNYSPEEQERRKQAREDKLDGKPGGGWSRRTTYEENCL